MTYVAGSRRGRKTGSNADCYVFLAWAETSFRITACSSPVTFSIWRYGETRVRSLVQVLGFVNGVAALLVRRPNFVGPSESVELAEAAPEQVAERVRALREMCRL